MKLYTAQFRYSGEDRFDITSRTSDRIGKLFAPPWSLVADFKQGIIDEGRYTDEYSDLLLHGIGSNPDLWVEFLTLESVTLVCYCRANTFCHRYIVVEFCKIMCKTPSLEYIGERMPSEWMVKEKE